MKTIAILWLWSVPFFGHSQYFLEDSIFGHEYIKPEMAPLTVENLQGIWKMSNKRRYDLAGDEMYETVVEYNHIYIEGNRIWEFEYPIQMYTVRTFEIKDSALVFISNKNFINSEIHFLNFGVAGVCEYGVTADKKTLCFGGDQYYKDSLDVQVINKLKNGQFNTASLYGTWQLKTDYDSGYDGFGTVDYIYPWKLPAVLKIDASNIHRYYGAKHFYLKIDGTKRPFNIEIIHINQWRSELVISPLNWYKETKEEPYVDEPFEGVHTSRITYEF